MPGNPVPSAGDTSAIRDALAELAPSGVVVAVERVGTDHGLWPDEERWVVHAGQSRRAQFAAGRRAARRALVMLGREPVAIARGRRGEPLWPIGVVGSISHTAWVAVAMATDAPVGACLGVDLERAAALRRETWHVVFAPGEVTQFEAEPELATVAFAAKEAAFKAWYPATGRDLDYLETDVAIDHAGTAVVKPIDGSMMIDVRWRVLGDLVVAVAARGPIVVVPGERDGGTVRPRCAAT